MKKGKRKVQEVQNHKPQSRSPSQAQRGRGSSQNQNKRKLNKRTKSTKISSLFPKRDNRNAKRTENTKTK